MSTPNETKTPESIVEIIRAHYESTKGSVDLSAAETNALLGEFDALQARLAAVEKELKDAKDALLSSDFTYNGEAECKWKPPVNLHATREYRAWQIIFDATEGANDNCGLEESVALLISQRDNARGEVTHYRDKCRVLEEALRKANETLAKFAINGGRLSEEDWRDTQQIVYAALAALAQQPIAQAEQDGGEEEMRIYKNTPEWDEYLRLRFSGVGIPGESFEFNGHRWKYRHSSFDDKGDFDVISRPLTPAPADKPAAQAEHAETGEVVELKFTLPFIKQATVILIGHDGSERREALHEGDTVRIHRAAQGERKAT